MVYITYRYVRAYLYSMHVRLLHECAAVYRTRMYSIRYVQKCAAPAAARAAADDSINLVSRLLANALCVCLQSRRKARAQAHCTPSAHAHTHTHTHTNSHTPSSYAHNPVLLATRAQALVHHRHAVVAVVALACNDWARTACGWRALLRAKRNASSG